RTSTDRTGDGSIALPPERVIPFHMESRRQAGSMAKKRSHSVRLRAKAVPLAGTIRVADVDRKIRKTGTRQTQTFKSKKTYRRSARKREDREHANGNGNSS
ncbi:MAG TPA: hypothetical protein VN397_01895, partial [Candidatus Methylomirabilis sp.]|nr:hypothetical protein [Candidatus Methylomirabilis sp.]